MTSIAGATSKYKKQVLWAIDKLGRIADLEITDVTRGMLQARFNELAKKMKPNSLNCAKVPVSSALKLAAIDGLIPSNPAQYLKLPRKSNEPVPVLDNKQILALIEHSRGHAGHAAIVLCALCGLRIGEVARLEPKHFQPGKLTVPGTKTAASARTIPLPSLVAQEIAKDKFPLANSQTHRAMQRAAERAGITMHVHPHLLRHTFSSRLEWLGCPIDVRSRLLGHGKKTITERYSHSAWNIWVHWMELLASDVCLGAELGTELGTDKKVEHANN